MLKKLIYFYLILGLPFYAMPQEIDTLWRDNPDISDSAKLELLGELCFSLLYEDTFRSRLVCDEMIQLTHHADNIYAKINAYRTAGIVYQELQNINKTFENYSFAIKLSEPLQDQAGKMLYGKTLCNFGLFYHKNGDYQTALQMYLKSDSILAPFHLINWEINTYSKISDVYDHLFQMDKCYYYNQKLVELAENNTDTFILITSYIALANNQIDDVRYKEAEKSLKTSLKLSEDYHSIEGIIASYYNLGYMENQQKNYDKAIEYYKKSEQVAKNNGDIYSACDVLQHQGSTYILTGNFIKAQKVIHECINLSRNNNYINILRQALEKATIIEDNLGNFKKALEYNKEYDQLLLQYTDSEMRKSINFLEAKYRAEKQENTINKLEIQQKLQLAKISRTRHWIAFLIILILLLTMSSILLHLNYVYKRKIISQENDLNKQRIVDLEKDKQLVATYAVLQGEESERTRLARDLHDGLGGLLSGIKLKLTGMKGNFIITDENAGQFDKALHLLDQSIIELRRVAHNMMPEILIKFGLKDAINDFCAQIQDSTTLKIIFQFFGQEKRIDKTIEISLYRITQELLNNIIRHAEANEVIVQLVQEEKRIHLTVQDDGKGFEVSQRNIWKGAGLSNINARIELLHGRMEIDSDTGKGTEIAIEFPLTN